MLAFFPDALNGYADFRVGGVANLSMNRVAPAFWVILAAFLLALSLSGELDVLLLGEETARSLGLPARRLRLVLLALAAEYGLCPTGGSDFHGASKPDITIGTTKAPYGYLEGLKEKAGKV